MNRRYPVHLTGRDGGPSCGVYSSPLLEEMTLWVRALVMGSRGCSNCRERLRRQGRLNGFTRTRFGSQADVLAEGALARWMGATPRGATGDWAS